jgi:hypothetical protein
VNGYSCDQALSPNPEFEIAIIHLGNAYAWHGRYAEAMRQYKRFIQVAPLMIIAGAATAAW